MSHYLTCPRCGTRTLERLYSYAHCLECGFSPEAMEYRSRLVRDPVNDLILRETRAANRTFARLLREGII